MNASGLAIIRFKTLHLIFVVIRLVTSRKKTWGFVRKAVLNMRLSGVVLWGFLRKGEKVSLT